MGCLTIEGGIICSGMQHIHELMLENGTKVWFEHHSYSGAMFWLDDTCYTEYPEWWNNSELVAFHDKYYKVDREVSL